MAKKAINIDEVLANADKEKSKKTFHGADKKAERLSRAENGDKSIGRPKKKEAEKAKPFTLYFTPEERKELEKAFGITSGSTKTVQKWSNAMLLKLASVINDGDTNRYTLMGMLEEKKGK